MTRIALAAAAFAPGLAHAEAWAVSNPQPAPLALQFFIGLGVMSVASVFIAWQSLTLAREQKRRRQRSRSPRA